MVPLDPWWITWFWQNPSKTMKMTFDQNFFLAPQELWSKLFCQKKLKWSKPFSDLEQGLKISRKKNQTKKFLPIWNRIWTWTHGNPRHHHFHQNRQSYSGKTSKKSQFSDLWLDLESEQRVISIIPQIKSLRSSSSFIWYQKF